MWYCDGVYCWIVYIYYLPLSVIEYVLYHHGIYIVIASMFLGLVARFFVSRAKVFIVGLSLSLFYGLLDLAIFGPSDSYGFKMDRVIIDSFLGIVFVSIGILLSELLTLIMKNYISSDNSR